MEASGYGRWFERWLGELQLELWIGDATQIQRKRVRKQKTDRKDAQLILKLMLKDDFPRIWVPSWDRNAFVLIIGKAERFQLWQASRQLSRRGSPRRLQR